jgi:hypothetical protein
VIERWSAALRSIRPRHGALELGPEPLEIHHRGEPFEIVILLRQPGEPLLDVEKIQPADPSDPSPRPTPQ